MSCPASFADDAELKARLSFEKA
ncbi:MAG: hypothetical protein JWO95_3526, partial [Verrucomicrobiales bacterium]|nr:hypothetical protein [Verrucomicrobiales bacterium]